jgi:sirohydrochlorin ferrochelatase
MTAPALIALAHGSRDPRSARTVREIVIATKQMRPDLRIDAAFLDHSRPDLDGVVDRLVARGHREIVVVPLLLTTAYHARVDVPEVVQASAARHPGVAIRVADVLGTDASLLTVLDERLREALRVARVRELDALVLAAAGSSDALANATVSRLARLWGSRHHLPTSVAFASAAPPSTGEAVREFRRAGRRHVAVGSLFIAPGLLPDRAAELAVEAGAVAVSAPLGAHAEVSRLLLTRYQVGALQLVEIPA